MRANKRFLGVSLSILLSSLLLVFLANVGAAGPSDLQTTDAYEEGARVGAHEISGAWAAESEETYGETEEQYEGEYQEQHGEEAVEEGSEYEATPAESEDEYSTHESSGEESQDMTSEDDDDLAQAPTEE